MKLDIYVNYKENCREAFLYYEKHLGGRITAITTFGEMPANPAAKGREEKIVHGRMEIGSTVLMGADIPNAEPMRSAYLTLTLSTAAEAERVYATLSEGGEIFMEMEETPFATRFAMLRDKFGTSWMLLCEKDHSR